MSLYITDKFVNFMDKLVTTMISSIMTILMLTVMVTNPILASEVDPDDVFGSEKECAQKFDPWYDRENFLACSGEIYIPK